MNEHDFFNIIYTLIIASFGALCKEINDNSKQHESLSIFFGEIILHGFSGWIVGLIANKYLGLMDLTSITIFAGIGGLFGFDLIKLVGRLALSIFANSKNIKIDKDDTNIFK